MSDVLMVAVFGKPDEVSSEEEWLSYSVSQRALYLSLLHQVRFLDHPRSEGALEENEVWAKGPLPGRIEALSKHIQEVDPTGAKLRANFFPHDDSSFSGTEDYGQLARAEVVRYYQAKNPQGLPVDIDQARVQLQVNGSGDTSFWIDVHFDQRPTFLPWNTNYTYAHRLGMRRSGAVSYSEPGSQSTNVAPGTKVEDLPATRRGFFPGFKTFQQQLDQIDAALRKAGSIVLPVPARNPPADAEKSTGLFRSFLNRLSGTPPPNPEPDQPVVSVSDGLRALERFQAGIVETATAYQIHFNSDRAELPVRLAPWFGFRFEIDRATSALSPVRAERHDMPSSI